IFNVLLSVITLCILFAFVIRYSGKWTALVALAVFSFHSECVVFGRMIFPYNLYMLLGFIVFFLSIEYLHRPERVFIFTASIMATFAIFSVYYAISIVVFLGVVIIYQRRWSHLVFLLIPCGALALFLLLNKIFHSPDFAEDFNALRQAARPGSFVFTLIHYREFFESNPLHIVGTLGLLFIPQRKIRWFSVLFVLLALYPVMRKADTIIKFVNYPVIPVLPFMAMGTGAVVVFLYTILRRSRIPLICLVMFLALIVIALSVIDIARDGKVRFSFEFPTPLEFAMVKNTDNAYKTADYVNKHTAKTDLVIASYNIWHLITARKSNLPISLAYKGVESDFFLYRISPRRFAYDPSLEKARYVILDFITEQMAKAPPGSIHYPEREAIENIKARWTKVAQFGEFQIFENPNYK
ncbi:hypothetical protein J7M23_09700, partial [Candidatus Sumerlaeota bacterium]|nr:hypothetical protein [Candidatus Sumerlaeota bacterium]